MSHWFLFDEDLPGKTVSGRNDLSGAGPLKVIPQPEASGQATVFSVDIIHQEMQQEKASHFELSLRPVKRIASGMRWQLGKAQFSIDGQTPQGAADEIGALLGSLLYPVYITTDANGGITGIDVAVDLQQRWQELQAIISQQYGGALIKEYLQQIDSKLNNPSILQAIYRDDLLINILFKNACGKYNADRKRQTVMFLPQFGNAQNVHAGLQLRVDYTAEADDMDNIQRIHVSGSLDSPWWTATGIQLWRGNKETDDKLILNGLTAVASGTVCLDTTSGLLSGLNMNITATCGSWQKQVDISIVQ